MATERPTEVVPPGRPNHTEIARAVKRSTQEDSQTQISGTISSGMHAVAGVAPAPTPATRPFLLRLKSLPGWSDFTSWRRRSGWRPRPS